MEASVSINIPICLGTLLAFNPPKLVTTKGFSLSEIARILIVFVTVSGVSLGLIGMSRNLILGSSATLFFGVTFVVLFRRERSQSPSLLQLNVMMQRYVFSSTILAGIFSVVLPAALPWIVFYLQDVHNVSVLQTGLAFLPLAAC